ncbi:Holo-[acyl-carrier-protein] synthase [Buchnera aphidicola (Takecallis arundicolens)]|uniref:holo-ACP synthase n=1 Tax=Buchnera aphidicola TaxID=9 RepID=UPI003464558E
MSIIGIGCDIIYLQRIKKIINIFGMRFAKRILSPKELSKFLNIKNKSSFIAKRFAVKEALFKSLGFGIRNDIKFKNFELIHNKLGKPKLVFLKQAKKILIKKNIKSIHVSISDEKQHIFAVVILEN